MYPAVYSYRKSRTRELELSIESLKNIKEWDGRVFIVGDKPDLNGEHMHLEIKYDWGKKSGIRSNDEVCAYETAADKLQAFIIMADDIYILKKWSVKYHNRGSLDDHAKSRISNDSYSKQLKRTSDYLEAKDRPTLSYELHIPFFVTAQQIKDAAKTIKESKPMFIRSLIANLNEFKSTKLIDPKNIAITDGITIYSSQDNTFRYDRVRKFLK